jgi:predicted nucleotidyltransferase
MVDPQLRWPSTPGETPIPQARVILFGSHARNDANPESDLDLLVIEPEVENAAMESVRLHRTQRGLGIPADVALGISRP